MTYAYLSIGRDQGQQAELDRALQPKVETQEDINRRNYEQLKNSEFWSKALDAPRPKPLPHRRRKPA